MAIVLQTYKTPKTYTNVFNVDMLYAGTNKTEDLKD